jgi:glutamyl-tRNA(Gln) amidotransferase subunit D
MYDPKVRSALAKGKIGPGDRVEIGKNGKTYEGILMPRAEGGNDRCMVIKLASGYNVGIDCRGARIKKVQGLGIKISGRDTPLPQFDEKKPAVSVITTGGTITSRADYRTGGVTSLASAGELLEKVPELSSFANVRMSSPFTMMSESMTHLHWQKLARAVASELRKSEGVIVTHGTDTLHYTSAALSFMLRDLGKPVILTGSQRSTDRGSSDGPMNLLCSARAALSGIAAVGICMHGSANDDSCMLIRGTKARKMHTSRRDAFRPVNEGPLAKVWPDGRIERFKGAPQGSGKAPRADTLFEPRVALLKSYPGAAPDIIDYYRSKGYRGLVIEATGLGQVPTYGKNSWLPAIKKAVDSGMVVCAAAQTIYGRLNPNVYAEGRMAKDAGMLHLEDMLPETAYVKLGWVLGHTKAAQKAKEMMLQNYAGEMTERSAVDSFLC